MHIKQSTLRNNKRNYKNLVPYSLMAISTPSTLALKPQLNEQQQPNREQHHNEQQQQQLKSDNDSGLYDDSDEFHVFSKIVLPEDDRADILEHRRLPERFYMMASFLMELLGNERTIYVRKVANSNRSLYKRIMSEMFIKRKKQTTSLSSVAKTAHDSVLICRVDDSNNAALVKSEHEEEEEHSQQEQATTLGEPAEEGSNDNQEDDNEEDQYEYINIGLEAIRRGLLQLYSVKYLDLKEQIPYVKAAEEAKAKQNSGIKYRVVLLSSRH